MAPTVYEVRILYVFRLEDKFLPGILSGYGANEDSVQEGAQLFSDRLTGMHDVFEPPAFFRSLHGRRLVMGPSSFFFF